MKIQFIFLTLLITTGAFASEKHTTSEIDIKQGLTKALLALSILDPGIKEDTQQPKQTEKKHTSIKKQIYKPQPKKQKYNRKKQTNNRIQQYRRR